MLLMMLLATSVQATPKCAKHKKTKSVGRILYRHIGFPDEKSSNAGIVAVKLKIDETGKPTILKIDGNNTSLQNHVEKAVAKIDPRELKVHAGGEFIVKINFKGEVSGF